MEILVALIVVAVAAAVVAVQWWTWRPVVTRRVMVQIADGTSISGVVVSRRGPLLVLDDVTVFAGADAQPADGRTVIERSRVLWMQVIG